MSYNYEISDDNFNQIKNRLEHSGEKLINEDLIKQHWNDASEYLANLTGDVVIGSSYHYILRSVVSSLYIRTGSETIRFEELDGYRVDYITLSSMFDQYRDVICTKKDKIKMENDLKSKRSKSSMVMYL